MKKSILLLSSLFIFGSTSVYANDAAKVVHSKASKQLIMALNKGEIIHLQTPASTVFVADPNIADFQVKSPKLIYLFAKKIGDTSFYALNKNGKVLASYNLAVTHNLDALKKAINSVAPGGKVSVTDAGDHIVLRGKVRTADQALSIKLLAQRFVAKSDKVLSFVKVTAPTQVNLRVQIIEMSRELTRALGIDWSATFTTGSSQFGFNPRFTPETFATRGVNGSAAGNRLNFFGNITEGNFQLNSMLDLLEQDNLVTVLSEPNLTALSGETATFLVGGEFPILIPQGNGTVSVDFKKFGVSLAFTPTILQGKRINLQVRPEVSQLSQTNAVVLRDFKVPSLTTRRAETTVELTSGQSFAIAGLLQNNFSDLTNQLPGLGDVPVLGNLFRSKQFLRQETELVIVVTPYIVNPAGNKELTNPVKGYGKKVHLTPAQKVKELGKGDIGFILN